MIQEDSSEEIKKILGLLRQNLFLDAKDQIELLLNKYPKFHIFWREYHKSKNTPTTITPKEQKRIQQYINKLPMSKVNTYLSLMLYYHTRATDQSDFDKILDKKEKLYETMIANKINLQNIENWADMF